MSPADRASLWELTAAPGRLASRFLLDDHARIGLDALDGATCLGDRRDAVRGANVIVMAGTQLATSLALLELDGLARRLVLCPPDLPIERLPVVMATAEAAIVLCDRPRPDIEAAGATCIVAEHPVRRATRETTGTCVASEWALFTSGTTGPPKMVLHSLHSLAGAIPRGADVATDSVWSTFYDIRRYGGLQILLRALIGGGSMVLSGNDEATQFLARAGAASVTFLSGTPTHWRRALLSPAAAAISPRDVRLSGEIADQAVLDKLRAAYPNARVTHAFASTEAGVAFEVTDGLAGFPADLLDRQRAGIDLRIQDGTLRIRSPRAASRYLGVDAEPLMDADGFVDTKDLVENRGGRYHFAGRKDGVINVGGLKVHPEEVEAVINRHPNVKMSLVKARRSPIIGAIVVADVVMSAAGQGGERDSGAAKALEGDIIALCREALAWYKVPASVRVVASLDVTAAGKLMRPRA